METYLGGTIVGGTGPPAVSLLPGGWVRLTLPKPWAGHTFDVLVEHLHGRPRVAGLRVVPVGRPTELPDLLSLDWLAIADYADAARRFDVRTLSERALAAVGHRKPTRGSPEHRAAVREVALMAQAKDLHPARTVAEVFGVSRSSAYAWLADYGITTTTGTTGRKDR